MQRKGGTVEPDRLRLMTWNIRAGFGNEPTRAGHPRVSDLAPIIRQLRETAADIVAIQEVDRGMVRSRGADQPAELARALGQAAWFGPNLVTGAEEYGLVLIGGPALTGVTHQRFPEHPGWEPRGYLRGTWTAPSGHQLDVYCTHLQVDTGGRSAADQRRESSSLLMERIRERGVPAVVMGDFNATPCDASIAPITLLSDAWGARGGGETVPVGPGLTLRRRIDYIWHTPEFEVANIEVIDTVTTRLASDHLPVVTEVVLG